MSQPEPQPPRPTVAGPATDAILRQLAVDQTEFRRVTRNINRFSALWHELREAVGARVGITGRQYSILAAVTHPDWPEGLTVKHLAEMIGVTAPLVTREGGKLIARGLLAKHPNSADGRSVLLAPTAAGCAAIDDIYTWLQTVSVGLFGDLDPNRFATLGETLEDLIQTLDRVLEPADNGVDAEADLAPA